MLIRSADYEALSCKLFFIKFFEVILIFLNCSKNFTFHKQKPAQLDENDNQMFTI